MANAAFRTEGVDKLASGFPPVLPEDLGDCGNGPSKQAGVVLCTPIRAQEEAGPVEEMSAETVKFIGLEHALKNGHFPEWERIDMLLEQGDEWG